MDIRDVISRPEYDFLKTNKYLGKNLLLATFWGSIAYGTTTPTSDIDIRGITANTRNSVFGLEDDFGKVEDSNTDTFIYSLRKIVPLLVKCNPNTTEMLYCKPEHYIASEEGQKLLNIREAFLSRIAIKSFGEYARQQFDRLEHGLMGNGANDDKHLAMMKHSLDRSIESFHMLHSNAEVKLNIEIISKEDDTDLWNKYKHPEKMEKLEGDIYVSGELHKCPVSELKAAMSSIINVYNDFGRMNKRNTKKDGVKLAKHMHHLLRMYYMGIELNKYGTLHTYREKEHDILMDVKNGKYMYNDEKNVKPEFYDLLHEVQKEYDESIRNTVLVESPNMELINETLYDIQKSIYI